MVLAFALVALCAVAPAAHAADRVKLVRVGSFESPVEVVSPPADAGRLFVVEQGGRIRVIRKGRTLGQPFLDLSGKISSGGERGLLSLAFHPNYAQNHLFYVYYTDHQGDITVEQYTATSST